CRRHFWRPKSRLPIASSAKPACQSRRRASAHARFAEVTGLAQVRRPASSASVFPTRQASRLNTDAVMMALIVSIPARDGASFLKPFAGFNRFKAGVSGEVEKLKPLCRTELRTPEAAAAIATG